DVPGGVVARIGEGAEVEAVRGALVARLVGRGGDARRHVGDVHDLDGLGVGVGGTVGVGHLDLDVGLSRAVREAAVEAAAAGVGRERAGDVAAGTPTVRVGRLVDREGVLTGVANREGVGVGRALIDVCRTGQVGGRGNVVDVHGERV